MVNQLKNRTDRKLTRSFGHSSPGFCFSLLSWGSGLSRARLSSVGRAGRLQTPGIREVRRERATNRKYRMKVTNMRISTGN